MAGNYANMGGNPMMMQGPPQPTQGNPMQTYILNHLANQPPLIQGGWQANTNVSERYQNILQMITQLRTFPQFGNDLKKIIDIALSFERSSFEGCADKESYQKANRDKLQSLAEKRASNGHAQQTLALQINAQQQRQAQMAAQMQQLGNQSGVGGPMQRPPMGQQPAQQFMHLQHQMQASPMPQQQQNMTMMNGGMPPNMVQQEQQQAQQMNSGMAGQPGPRPMQQGPPFPPFTRQETIMVNNLANQMMSRASEGDLRKLRETLQSRQDYQQRAAKEGVDPVFQYYRNQAASYYRNNQNRQALTNQGIPTGPTAVSMQPQMSSNPVTVNGQATSAGQIGGNADFGGFLGDMNNLMAQQQQADTGLMGPAGNMAQGSATPQGAQPMGRQPTGPNGQRPLATPNFPGQQIAQAFNAQQHQAQSQAQIRANAAAKAQQQLHGQPGGMGPMPSQQSPAMTNLTAPMGTPQQPPPAAPSMDGLPMVPPPGGVPFGQPGDPRFAQMNGARGMPGNPMNNVGAMGSMPAFPPNMPPETRQRMLNLPPDKLEEVLRQWHASKGQQPGMMNNQPGPQRAVGMPQNPGPFMGVNMNPQPNAQLMAQMTSQQQQAYMLRQRQLAQQQAQIQARQSMPNVGTPGDSSMIDNIPVPDNLLQQNAILRTMPPGNKSWGAVKHWVSQNPAAMQANLLEMLKNYQKLHWTQLLRQRQRAQQAQAQAQAQAQSMGQPMGQPQPNPAMVPPGMAPVAPMQRLPNGAPFAMPDFSQIGPDDINRARAHPSGRFANLSDEQVREVIIRNAQQRRMAAMQQQQQQQQLQQQQQQEQQRDMSGQMSQAMQAPAASGQVPIQRPLQQVPPNPSAPSQPPKQVNKQQPGASAPQQQPMAKQQAPTPQMRAGKGVPAGQPALNAPNAPTKNNLKRASSDDVVEVPNPHAAPPNLQRPVAQPRGGLSPQRIANMTPEQRKKYHQELARQQAMNMAKAVPPQPVAEGDYDEQLKAVQALIPSEAAKLVPVPMAPEAREAMANRLFELRDHFNRVKQVLKKWYLAIRDVERFRRFFLAYFRLTQQFTNANALEETREIFTMTGADVEQGFVLARSIFADLARAYPNMMKMSKPGAGPAQAAGGSAPGAGPGAGPTTDGNNNNGAAAAAAPAPLSSANLQSQQQALQQQMMKAAAAQNQNAQQGKNRAANRPPPAPTTAQAPPFPNEVVASRLTQDDLKLPGRKKQKQNATSTPVLSQQPAPPSSSQQQQQQQQQPQKPNLNMGHFPGAKTPADEKTMQLQPPEPVRSQFHCPEAQCDHHHYDPFEDQAALDKHFEEEHAKPIRDPTQFVLGELREMLNLDENGKLRAPPKEDNAETKPATGAPSTTAMDRQASRNSTKTSPELTRNKVEAARNNAQQAKDNTVNPEVTQLLQSIWSVNPLDLQNNFGFSSNIPETGGDGAISDMNVYRSIATPNDTPESSASGSKDSSEPNSDISEALDLKIDLDMNGNWQPFGPPDTEGLLGGGLDGGFAKMDFGSQIGEGESLSGGLSGLGAGTGVSNGEFDWNEFMEEGAWDTTKPMVWSEDLYSYNMDVS